MTALAYRAYVDIPVHEIVHLAGKQFFDVILAQAAKDIDPTIKGEVPSNVLGRDTIPAGSKIFNNALRAHCSGGATK